MPLVKALGLHAQQPSSTRSWKTTGLNSILCKQPTISAPAKCNPRPSWICQVPSVVTCPLVATWVMGALMGCLDKITMAECIDVSTVQQGTFAPMPGTKRGKYVHATLLLLLCLPQRNRPPHPPRLHEPLLAAPHRSHRRVHLLLPQRFPRRHQRQNQHAPPRW